MKFLYKTSNDEYQKFEVGAYAHIIIFNDSPVNYLEFSLNGDSQNGVILPKEGIEFRDVNLNTVYVKNLNAGADVPFRIWAYGKREILYSKNQIQSTEYSPKTLDNFSSIKRVFVK